MNDSKNENTGQVWIVSYKKPHKYRGGKVRKRSYTKKVFVPGKNPQWDLENKKRKNRQGNVKYGIKVVYDNPVSGSTVERQNSTYKISDHTQKVEKIVEIPEEAEDIKVQKVNNNSITQQMGLF